MPRDWRLLLCGAGSGPWNMGVDEALMTSAAAGLSPTLRLYAWSGPWLSLGYGQALAPERRTACAAAGVGVVRRATGGRAVLHGCDLTYAVAAPETALPAGLAAAYEVIAAGLEAGLRSLGVAVEPALPGGGGASRADFDCFAGPAGHELCVAGLKLVGSAQRRAGGALLQHGSLRLAPEAPGVREAAGLAGPGATSLAELGFGFPAETLQGALLAGFSEALGARFEPGRLSGSEARRAGARAADAAPARVAVSRGEPQGYPLRADK